MWPFLGLFISSQPWQARFIQRSASDILKRPKYNFFWKSLLYSTKVDEFSVYCVNRRCVQLRSVPRTKFWKATTALSYLWARSQMCLGWFEYDLAVLYRTLCQTDGPYAQCKWPTVEEMDKCFQLYVKNRPSRHLLEGFFCCCERRKTTMRVLCWPWCSKHIWRWLHMFFLWYKFTHV